MATVFYVDDEEVLCENFSDLYSGEKVDVRTFVDPEEAIKAAAEVKPSLVFLDYRLVGTTGDAIAQQMDAGIPKFLVTGDLNVQCVYQFEEVLVKPTKPQLIHDILTKYLKD